MLFEHFNNRIFYALLCSLTMFISSIFSLVAAQVNTSSGYLKIESDSIKSEIRLNKQSLGFTPLPIIALQPGDYIISVAHPNRYLWGNIDWQDSIRIVANDTLTIQPKFKRMFSIRTNPFGAEVFLNNELLGTSPLSVLINSHQNYQLLIKKDGFKDYLIDLQQINNNFLNVNLMQNKIQLDLTNSELRQHLKAKHRYRAATYSLWGLSILTGLSTVYLKDRADDKYQQYLAAGSLSEMNKYYNEAKKYDCYTCISAGILQGLFALSFYFLMKSLD